jgi:rhamnogalacturonan II specific xylosyltransferase
MRHKAVNNVVILSQTNCGFLPLTENWLRHISLLGITNFLLIAEDAISFEYLHKTLPAHVISALTLANNTVLPTLVEFGTDAFWHISCLRPMYLFAVLELTYTVLWTDMDTVWLKTPLEVIPLRLEYVGVDDLPYGSPKTEQDTDALCTAFMYLRPTRRVFDLIRAWHSSCHQYENDQFAFNAIMSLETRQALH